MIPVLVFVGMLYAMKLYRSLPLLLGKNHDYKGSRFTITKSVNLYKPLIVLFDKKKNKTYTSEYGSFWFTGEKELSFAHSMCLNEAYKGAELAARLSNTQVIVGDNNVLAGGSIFINQSGARAGRDIIGGVSL